MKTDIIKSSHLRLDEDSLFLFLRSCPHLDAIVVEGYDGVGKGRLLELLSDSYGAAIPYRPDYNFWQNYDLRKEDRWKISGFFWDVFSHFYQTSDRMMLFDRGVISGAVYNNDRSIAEAYRALLKDDLTVLHIIVVCDSERTYKDLQSVRNPELTEDELDEMFRNYEIYTSRYFEMLDLAQVNYVIYENKFIDKLGSVYSHTCGGCGHYSSGSCQHPKFLHEKRSVFSPRCEYSLEKEVQDRDAE